MPVSTMCNCGMRFALADELAGRQVRCPKCKAVFVAPRRVRTPVAVAAGPKTPPPRPVKRSREEVRALVQSSMAASTNEPIEEEVDEGPTKPLASLGYGALALVLVVFAVMLKAGRAAPRPST